jgi:hypothetical protein
MPGLCGNVSFAHVPHLNIMIHTSNAPQRGYGLLARRTTSAATRVFDPGSWYHTYQSREPT